MKKILLLMVVVLGVVTLASCGQETIQTWEGIEDRGYMIVGLDDTFAPMGFRDDQGELTGFDVDLANEVGRRLNIEVRFQPIDWDAKVLELNSGTIDMIWNGLTITESRLEEMAFSNPYLENTQMVMILKDAEITNITGLAGLKVGVQISSASEDAVVAADIYDDLGELVKFDTFNSALLELQNQTVDAVVIDEIMGRYIMSLNPGVYDVLEDNFGEETYGIGFRLESSDIRDQINQALADMIADGKASEISVKWFDEDIFLR
jgi:polar amino acid transport system substrate-binding protein